MLIIPAIDLKDGKCVRLIQGRMQDETVYSDDPEAVARRWAEAGARLLHVVDLDAAIQGTPRNQGCIRRIIRAAGVPVQVGGGMRDTRAVDACLAMGAHRVVVGTAAAQDLGFVRSTRAADVWPRTAGPGPPTSGRSTWDGRSKRPAPPR